MELENAFVNFLHFTKLKLICFEICIKNILLGSGLYISHFIIENIYICLYKRFKINSFSACLKTFVNKTHSFSMSIWQQEFGD